MGTIMTTRTKPSAYECYENGTRVGNSDGTADFQYNGYIARCRFENGEYQSGWLIYSEPVAEMEEV
jgi:hypothetical protein